MMSVHDCSSVLTRREQEIISSYYQGVITHHDNLYIDLHTTSLMEGQLKKLLILITDDINIAKLNLKEIKFRICRHRTILDHFVSGILSFVDSTDSLNNMLAYHNSLLDSDDKRVKPILEFENYKANIGVLEETRSSSSLSSLIFTIAVASLIFTTELKTIHRDHMLILLRDDSNQYLSKELIISERVNPESSSEIGLIKVISAEVPATPQTPSPWFHSWKPSALASLPTQPPAAAPTRVPGGSCPLEIQS